MGSESVAHEAEGWMGYWLRGHEDKRNNKVNILCLLKLDFNPFLLTKNYKIY